MSSEQRTVEIIVKGQQANASIKEMGAAAAVMRNQLEKMAADDPRRAKLAADLTELKERIAAARKENEAYAKSQVEVVANGKKVEASFDEMKESAAVLERQLHSLAANDPARQQLLRDYQDLQKRIHAVSAEMNTAQQSSGLLRSAFASAVGVFAGGGLLDLAQQALGFFSSSREEFASSAQAGAQLDATLKSTGQSAGLTKKKIEEIAEARAKLTLFDDDDTKGAASLLLTFTNIKDGVFQEALPAIQDLSAKMGTDLNASAVQVGKALNDPIKGITALSRVGVSFSEDQKKVIEQLVATGDTAGAQRLILAELSKEFGGSAEAARKAGGGVATLQMSYGELKESIGEFVNDGLSRVSLWLGRVLDKSQPLVDIFTELGTEVGELFADLYDVAEGLGLVSKNSDSAGTFIKILTGVISFLLAPIQLAVRLVSGLADGFVLLYNKSELVRGTLGGIGAAISSFFGSIRDNAVKALEGVGDLLVGIFTLDPAKIKSGLSKTFGAVADQYTDAGRRAGEAFVAGYEQNKDRKIVRTVRTETTTTGADAPGAAPLAAEDNSLEATARAKAEKEEAAAERRREAAARKVQAAEEREAKARIAAANALMKQIEALEDARILSIQDKRLREIAQINLDAQRKKRDVVGSELEVAAQLEAIELERQERQADATEKYNRRRAEEQKKLLSERLATEDQAELEREAALMLRFEDALLSEEERDLQLYEMKKASLERKLALEEFYLGKEASATTATKKQLMKLEADHAKEVIAATKRREDAKAALTQEGLKVVGAGVDLTIQILGRDEAARKKNAELIKAIQVGKITTDSFVEVQGIWANSQSSPLAKALGPAAVIPLAIAQTALSIARAGLAVRNVNAQQFFGGGETGGGLRVPAGGGDVAIDIPGLHVGTDGRLRDSTGSAIAGVVHENEWVMPAWMRRQPDVIPLERHLERRRLRGYMEGGPTSEGSLPSTLPAGGSDTRLAVVLEQLNERLQKVEDWPRQLAVFLSVQELESELATRKKARLDSEIR